MYRCAFFQALQTVEYLAGVFIRHLVISIIAQAADSEVSPVSYTHLEEPNKYVKELTPEKYKYGFTTEVHTDICLSLIHISVCKSLLIWAMPLVLMPVGYA